MTFSGYVRNVDGEALAGASFYVQNATGQSLGYGTVVSGSGFFSLYVPDSVPVAYVVLSHVGYHPQTVPANMWENGQTILMMPKVVTLPPVVVESGTDKPFPWAILAAGGVLLIVANEKKGKIGAAIKAPALNINTAVIVAGGLVVSLVLNKLFVKLGLGDGAGSENVANEQTNPGSPWSPTFYTTAPAGSQVLLIPNSTADTMAQTIFQAFKIHIDDINAVMSVFRVLKTQSQVSYLAHRFRLRFNLDLLTYLTNGGGSMPWDGLSDKNLKVITDLVRALPKYNI